MVLKSFSNGKVYRMCAAGSLVAPGIFEVLFFISQGLGFRITPVEGPGIWGSSSAAERREDSSAIHTVAGLRT